LLIGGDFHDFRGLVACSKDRLSSGGLSALC
jgi:hypothetical protein